MKKIEQVYREILYQVIEKNKKVFTQLGLSKSLGFSLSTVNLAVKKLNLTDDSILIDLISLSDYRNDFIHSDSSKRSKLKVLQSKEILKWSTSVTSIIKNL